MGRTVNALDYNGIDMGDRVNRADSGMPNGGGAIYVPGGVHPYSTPILIGTNSKATRLVGAGNFATILNYLPTSGTAVTIDPGQFIAELPSPSCASAGISDLSIQAKGGAGTAVGLQVGGTLGVRGGEFRNTIVTGFSKDLVISNKVQITCFYHCIFIGGTRLLECSGNSDTGENIAFYSCQFSGATTNANAIYLNGVGNSFWQEFLFDNCSFDYGAQIYARSAVVRLIGGHLENDYNDYFIVADDSAVLSVNASVFAVIANPSTIDPIHALSGSRLLLQGSIGTLKLAQGYKIVNADAGSNTILAGLRTTNDLGFWATPAYDGVGTVTVAY